MHSIGPRVAFMADGDRETVAGWTVREDWRLAWNQGASESDLRLCVCGEIGHVRWLLFRVAVREAARRDLDTLLSEFAQRVGVEYTSTRGAHGRQNITDTESTGGTP